MNIYLEKLDTMTGTGRAMTSTPDREQILPIILPIIVLGTMSPYLKLLFRLLDILINLIAIVS